MPSIIHSFDELRKVSAPELEPFRDIIGSRACSQTFLVESELVLQRALQSKWTVQAILGTPSRIKKLQPYCGKETRIIEASQQALDEWAGFPLHRGCVGQLSIPAHRDETCLQLSALPNRVVVAEQHSDPANIGSLLRNARALGADLVVIDSKGASPYSRKTARASAGHLFSQPFVVTDARMFVQQARQSSNHTIIGATLGPESIHLSGFAAPPQWVLCLGNEGSGLSPEILEHCGTQLTIPMQNNVDSLNVAAATALLLYALNQPSAEAWNNHYFRDP